MGKGLKPERALSPPAEYITKSVRKGPLVRGVVWVCRQETKPWLTELHKKDNTCS